MSAPNDESSTTDALDAFNQEPAEQHGCLKENEDLITQVTKYIQETTMTSTRWAEDVALSLLSTVMGNERCISDRKGKLKLNIWFLCIGPSSLATKTTPLKNYFVPILIRLGEMEKYPFLLPSKFSVEALTDYMGKCSSGCMYRDEMTSMLKESASKDYLSDSLEFLSELYDGTIQKRITFSHGHTDVKSVYVTFISATTPYLYKILKTDFYTQGTGNRILPELFSESDIDETPINPETFFEGPKFEAAREHFIESVAQVLSEIRRSKVQYLVPDEAAGKIWAEYHHECTVTAKTRFRKNMYDIHYSFITRMPEMALKLAGLYSISRMWSQIILEDAPNIQMIFECDMKRAIDKTKRHYQEFCKMLDQWRNRPEPALFKTIDEQASFITEKLSGNAALRWTDLRRDSKWDSRAWLEVLKYLHDSEKVIVYQAPSNGGRRAVMICSSDTTPEEGSAIFKDWRAIEGLLNLR